MNLNGNSIIVKKRAMDPDVKSDMATLLANAEKVMEVRGDLLAKNKYLKEEVMEIKSKSIEELEKTVFKTAEKMKKKGMSVFIAKKPIDVAEYIRGIIDGEQLGVVPSPQTMEAEVMQAFFMSNKVQILSDKYIGYEKGLTYVHPYFPYPQEKGKAKKSEVNHAIISAVVLTENGNGYLEEEEMEVLRECKDPFIIVTADRIFSEKDADHVEHLIEIASGKAIKAAKTDLKGHVIILDNGRMALSRSNMKDLLMCVNCYACSLSCPIYLSVGGLFGSPMMAGIGALSVSYQSGIKAGINRGLNYCTLCRKCEVECPTKVPITALMQKMRKKVKVSGF